MKDEHIPLYQPEKLIAKLKLLIRKAERFQESMCEEITRSQARIIFPIVCGEGHTIQELANINGVAKSLVSRTIADLEKKGYVERDKKTQDQDRNYNIILTPKGQELHERKKAQAIKLSTWLDDKLKHEDMQTFLKVLDIITDTDEER